MVNVSVHLEVGGLPENSIDDDAFIDAVVAELPDAGVGGAASYLSITLSQFALSIDRAARKQVERTRDAFAAIGLPDVQVQIAETVREDWRDDVGFVGGAVRFRV